MTKNGVHSMITRRTILGAATALGALAVTTIGLGSNPRAGLNGQVRQTMNADDMRDYTRSLRQILISFGRPKRTGNGAISVAAP